MNLLKSILLILLFLQIVSAQSQDDKIQFVGDFNFNNSYEKIVDYKLTDDGKLTVVNGDNFLVWDIKIKKVIEKKHHGAYFAAGADSGVFSPDKKRVVLLSRQYTERDALNKKVKKYTVPELWNVETGEKIAVFDKLERPLQTTEWSGDGAVLMTNVKLEGSAAQTAANQKKADETVKQNKISFWDGKTGALRSEIVIDNLVWSRFLSDGTRFLAASGPKREFLGIDYASEKAAAIDVWNTATGKIEKSFPIGDDVFFSRTGKLKISPDEKLIALIQKSRQKDADDRLLVFRIEGDQTSPELIIKANPQITDSFVSYTPDSKFVALDAGKIVQIYALENGAKKSEMTNDNVPQFWFAGNQIAVYNFGSTVTGVRTASGQVIYRQEVPYRTETRGTGSYTTDSNGNTTENTETVVVDSTTIVPHPGQDFFLEYSNKYTKIRDAANGSVLQTLVQPKLIVKRKVKILGIPIGSYVDDGENTVLSADWSPNGKYALVRKADGRTLSVWEVKK